MRVNERMKKVFSILLCLCMVLQYVPTTAFAVDAAESGLCEHHTEHTVECHYVEAVEGQPCAHVHDELCGYIEAVAEVLCACEATDENGALVHTEGCGYVAPVTGADCTHSHDEACGYVAAVEAHECHYECAECAAAPASEEPSEEPSKPAPVCDCGTDDPAIHATTCAVYEAPENPQCFCVEKCTEANVWCDICGIDYSKCTGTDTAVAYADDLTLQDTDGDGYYEISNADELYAFAAAVNGGNTAINGELTADIVVNEGTMTAETTGARAWTPIGYTDSETERYYTGTFDGYGHTVSGLYFFNDSRGLVGLFGYSKGTVQNVGIEDSYFNGYLVVGSVVGYNAGGTVQNCYNTGNVSSSGQYVGGVVGSNDGTVTNCYNAGTVSGSGYVGGVVGQNEGTVTNCYNTGTVSGDTYVGGVVGENKGTVTNCYNTGTVTCTGYDYGGVVGANAYANSTVTNCYYLDTCGATGYGTDKTAEQFASGEVAYLLNSSTSEGELVWKQTLGENGDAVPSFTGGTVYQVTNCIGGTAYSNTNETIGHTGGTATCTTLAVCDICKTAYGELGGHSFGTDSKCDICDYACTHETSQHESYTDLTDNTHNFLCTVCNQTIQETHSYDTTTHRCDCGQMEPGWYTVTYPNFVELEHCVGMTVSPDVAQDGTTVTVVVEMEDGYSFQGMAVTADDRTKIPHTTDETGNIATMAFVMPEQNVRLIFAKPSVYVGYLAEGLVYTGEELPLIQETEVSNGTLQFSLDGVEWTEEWPKATDVGTYSFAYRVLGDEGYMDLDPVNVPVRIGKAEGCNITGDITVANNVADTYTFDLSGYDPTFGSWGGNVSYALGTVSFTDSGYYTSGAKIEDNKLILPINKVESTEVSSLGTVTVKITSQNFAESTLTLTVNRINHAHVWSYSADETTKTITAKCANTDGHCNDKEQSFMLNAPDVGYSGNPVEAEVTRDGTDLTFTLRYTGTNYDSADAPTNAGDYTVTMTVGDKSVSDTFTISPKNISKVASCQFSLTQTSFVYSGKTPVLNVTGVDSSVGSYTMQEGTDYTVGIVQVNAGSHKLTVTGIGNYTGTVELDYTITAKEVSIIGAAIQPVTYDPNGYTLTVTGVTFDGVVDGETLAYTAEATLGNTNVVGEQDATVTVTLNNSNYTLEDATYETTVTINKAEPEIVWNTGYTNSYGKNMYITAYVNGVDGEMIPGTAVATVYDANGNALNSVTCTKTDSIGTYFFNWLNQLSDGTYLAAESYVVELTYQGNENYNAKTVELVTYTIAKADPVIGTVGCKMPLFDSTDISTVELTRTDMSVDGTLILTDSELTAGEGTYNWKFTPEDTDNYNTITGTVVLTVTADVLEQIRATGTLEKFSYVYGEPFSIDGMTITASYTSGTTKDVTGLVSFDRTLAVGQTAVELTYQGKICVIDGITVARKQLDVSGMAWDVPENAVYSGTAYTATLNGTLPEGVSVTKTGDTATNAGSYTAKAVFSLAEGYSADNYEIVNGEDLTAEWSIDKAALTITADSYESVRYGSAAPAFAANYSGFVNGETEAALGGELVFSCEYDTADAAKRKPGDYPIVPSGLTSNNYEISYVDGNLEVISANLVIVIDDKTVTYGDAAPEYTYHYEGFVYGEDISVMDEPGTVSCAYIPGNAVGTMEIKSDNYGSDDCYFVVNQRIGTLTVEKAPLIVTAKDNTITYGDEPSASGVEYSGFVNNETESVLTGTVAYSYNYEQFGNVGTYKITPVGLTSDNYEITFADGTLTVNAKAITVTADAVSKTYGDTDPTLTYTAQGLVNGDELTGELKRVAGENVGSYAIEQNTLTAGNNYSITYTGANLTINAKAITEADVELNGSLTYTGKELTQPITVTEDITYEVTGNKATNVGTYELTVKGIGNYTGSVTLDWTIAKAKLTITADSKVIYIGEKLPTLTYTTSGLVGGDKLTKEPVLTTNADADQAGSYTITAANADAGMNYAITYVGGTLTIMDKNTEVETKVETAALTEVPDGLKNTKFNTVEAIKQELTSRIVATSTGFAKENMAHYDVTLQFSLDGGENWILATEENFPTEGITVTLPYPNGTNAAGYDFVVSHMFTVTSQRLGTIAGEVEMPKVEETANGIRVTLNGLSPVTVAARYHDHTGGIATCTDKAICSICGTAYGELDATNHAGGTEVKNAKEATCGAEGYTGDTHCKGCGEIVEKGAAIKATGEHTYGDWKVVKEPTKTTKGEKQRTCSVCGHVDSKEIPVLSDTPATGDNSNIMLYSSMFTVSLAGLVVLLLATKKRKQETA